MSVAVMSAFTLALRTLKGRARACDTHSALRLGSRDIPNAAQRQSAAQWVGRLGSGKPPFVATRARLLVFVIVAFGATACDHKANALSRTTECLHKNHARVSGQPGADVRISGSTTGSTRRAFPATRHA